MAEKSQKSRNKRRLKITLAALLAVALAWTLFEHFVLRVDRYRPLVVEELEKATGLRASIRKLDLALFPSPRLRVYDTALGESDFRADVPLLTIDVNLASLVRRKIHIEKIDIGEIELRLPGNFTGFQAKIELLLESLTAPREESSFELSAVDSIEVARVRAYVGDSEDPLLEARILVGDALGDTISLDLQSQLPLYGDSARAEIHAALTLDGASGAISAVEATASLENFDIAKLPLDGAPDAVLNAEFTAKGTGFDYLKVEVEGGLESDSTPSLAGDIASVIWWDHGTLTVNDLAYNAKGIQLRADATRHESGEIVAQIASAVVKQSALASIAAMVASEDIRVEAADGAAFEVSDVIVTLDEKWRPNFVQGRATFSGLNILTKEGEAITLATRGELEARDGLIQVAALEGDGFSLKGSLDLDWENESLAVEASGNADLSKARLGAFLPTDEIRDITGIVVLERLAATITRAGGMPEDLVVVGTLRDGAFSLATSDLEDRFSKVSATFSSDTDGIDTDLSATSERLGGLAAKGRYAFDTSEWAGTATLDVPRVVENYIRVDEQREYAAPLLAQYGESRFHMTISLPREGAERITITASRDGEPMLEGRVVLARTDDGFALDAVNGKTRAELDALSEVLPSGLILRGQANVSFLKESGSANFSAEADLTHCSAQAGDYLSKRAGDPLVLTLTGDSASGAWQARDVTIHALGERVVFAFQEERLVASALDLDMTAFARLLPEGATARGRVRGKVALSPFEADLQLEQVGFAIDEALRLDSVDGPLSIANGYFTCRDLTIRGAQSDCVVNAGWRDGHWEGSLSGEKLDVDAVLALVAAAQAFGESPEGEIGEATPAEPLVGQFSVRLDQLHYGGGRVDNLRANVLADASAIRVTGISLRPYSGEMTGAVTLARVDGKIENIIADLRLDGVELRILDDMFFEEPRGIHGIVTGSISGNAPFGTGREMLAGANGTVRLEARDGSMGRMGAAGAVLKVLRATEIFALKLPSLKEKGLTYDSSSAKLRFVQGVMTIEETTLASTAYSMEAKGSANFAAETTDIVVLARVLESVNSLVRRIPGLRDAVRAGTDLAAVRLRASGSPYEPEVAIVGGASSVKPVEKVVDKARGALRRLIPKREQ